MILGFDGGWSAYEQQGLRYQRGEAFTVAAIAVPSSRDVTSEIPHVIFVFCLICHSLHPL